MIKINLALRKQAAAIESAKDSTPSKLSLANFKFDSEIFKEPQLRKLVLVVVVAAFATYMLNGYKDEQLERLDRASEKATAEGTKARSDLAKTSGFEQLKKQFDSDEELIKTKLTTIQKLLADRQAPPKLLMSFSGGIPKDVWLSELIMTDKDLHVKGSSLGFDQITDFMKFLGENEYLSDLRLVNSQKSKEDGLDVASFELEAKRK